MSMQLTWQPSLNQVRWQLKPLIHLLALIPALLLTLQAYEGELGTNPIETLTHTTGDWALYFLLITLAITPLRKQFGLSWLLQFRRMLGLYAFFYALMHFLIYLLLDKHDSFLFFFC